MASRDSIWPRLLGLLAWLVFTLTLTALGAEIAIRATGLFSVPRDFTRVDPSENEDGNRAEGEAGADQPLSKRVPHPYLGWVHRPGMGRTNSWGFPSEHGEYSDLSEDDFVFVVTGGSVALGVALLGEPGLVAGIVEERPDLEGRIRLVNLALGGYKQPQQYFAVSQALLLGVPIDAVINLDGFNEMALGYVDAKRRSNPLFPRRAYWEQAYSFAAAELTASQIEATATALRERRQIEKARRELRQRSLLRHSELYRAWVGGRMLRSQAAAVAAEQALTEQESAEEGPDGEAKPEAVSVSDSIPEPCAPSATCDEHLVRLWAESSRMLADLCEARGIAYLHGLQPNQYVAPAKPLTEEELARAWDPEHVWSRTVVRLFPKLREAATSTLEPAGIRFLDLTDLFENETESVYIDTCCHFDEEGYQEIGRALGRGIAQEYSALGQ